MIRLRAGKLVSQPYPKVPLELLQLLLQVAGELASAIGSSVNQPLPQDQE